LALARRCAAVSFSALSSAPANQPATAAKGNGQRVLAFGFSFLEHLLDDVNALLFGSEISVRDRFGMVSRIAQSCDERGLILAPC